MILDPPQILGPEPGLNWSSGKSGTSSTSLFPTCFAPGGICGLLCGSSLIAGSLGASLSAGGGGGLVVISFDPFLGLFAVRGFTSSLVLGAGKKR